MITLLIAQIIINSYSFGTAAPAGGAGFLLQQDGTSFLMQQDGTSKLQKEFTAGGFILQEDNFFLFQQDGTCKYSNNEKTNPHTLNDHRLS